MYLLLLLFQLAGNVILFILDYILIAMLMYVLLNETTFVVALYYLCAVIISRIEYSLSWNSRAHEMEGRAGNMKLD